MKSQVTAILILSTLIGIGIVQCSEEAAAVSVSINGLQFLDTGCSVSNCDGGIDLSRLNPEVYMGIFNFIIRNNNKNELEDIEEIKKSRIFNHPISDLNYYGINQTEISGWPAIIGVVQSKTSYGDNCSLIGFIYIDDIKIELDVNKGLELNEIPELLRRINITVREDIANASVIYPEAKLIELGNMGLHIYPGQLSDSDMSCAVWLDKKLTMYCSQPYLIVSVMEVENIIDDEKDKNILRKLITKGISNSSITYLNISKTTLSDWPATVAILNSTKRYASGIIDPPEIRIFALIHAKNLTILEETGAIWEKVPGESSLPGSGGEVIPGIQPDEIYRKLQSVKLVIEPGAEQMWNIYLARCYRGYC